MVILCSVLRIGFITFECSFAIVHAMFGNSCMGCIVLYSVFFGNGCIVLCLLEMVASCSAFLKLLHCDLYLEMVALCSVLGNGYIVLCIWKWLHCALY